MKQNPLAKALARIEKASARIEAAARAARQSDDNYRKLHAEAGAVLNELDQLMAGLKQTSVPAAGSAVDESAANLKTANLHNER